MFFIFMDLTVIVTAVYMYGQTVGFSKRNRKKNLLLESICFLKTPIYQDADHI